MHIVGLGFDADNEALRAGLAATRGGRRERALEMAEGLARVGIQGAFEGALKYVKNPELISRTHFARHLVESKVCQREDSIDEHFIVTQHPDLNNVWLVGGGSGHGYKHGIMLGDYVARRVVGRDDQPELAATFALKTGSF